jgi:DNA-binding MarR family transcriptional regulator
MAGAKLELESFLPYRLNVLASVVSHGLSSIYIHRYGFGIPEWRVMATLGQFGTITAKDIGTHSHMHKTKVSRAVANLTRRKLVQRKANRQDLREAFLSLTPPGKAIYDDLVPVAQRYAAELAGELTPDEAAQFDALLAKLTDRSKAIARQRAAQEPELP